MIAIVESGSTKSDWVFLNNNKDEIFRTETIGFNPHFIDKDTIVEELLKNKLILENKDTLERLYFYGAGCSSPSDNKIIEDGMAMAFTDAKILVDHDLLGAAYSAYFDEPAIICILGTGSNSCYFDGKKTREEVSSLGYVLGDYGSGSFLGKKLLRSYVENKLTPELKEELKRDYNVSVESILDNIYRKPFPNRYLASFSPFIYKNRNNPYIQRMIYDSIRLFFETHIMSYPEAFSVKINFIGSISYYYQEIIEAVASHMRVKVGHIVSRPIDRLVEYHIKHIL